MVIGKIKECFPPNISSIIKSIHYLEKEDLMEKAEKHVDGNVAEKSIGRIKSIQTLEEDWGTQKTQKY